MLRTVSALIAASGALLGATAAQAGTHWSVDINVPIAGIVVSNGGGYYVREPAPVYYVPAPEVRYAPVPRYVAPEPYYEPSRAYAPPVVRPAPEFVYDMHDRGWHRDHQSRWEQRQEFQHARREHERHDSWYHDRERDDGDSHRWHRD